jgi:hypothetical protein
MDGLTHGAHHARVRVLPHIKRLDDCFGDFLVRVTCPCGASRHIEPEALARIAGRSATFAALGRADAVLAVWEQGCRGRCGGEAEPARRSASMSMRSE